MPRPHRLYVHAFISLFMFSSLGPFYTQREKLAAERINLNRSLKKGRSLFSDGFPISRLRFAFRHGPEHLICIFDAHNARFEGWVSTLVRFCVLAAVVVSSFYFPVSLSDAAVQPAG